MIEKDLYQSRNMRQPFSKGFFVGGAHRERDDAHQGRLPRRALEATSPTRRSRWRSTAAARSYPKPDNKYLFDKLNSVFLSGNATRDDAPNHIRIQERVPREVAQTWVSMCPAQVYEIPEDQLETGAETVDVHVTPSNCVQCGAITAKGGRLTLPEGGDGPLYQDDLLRGRAARGVRGDERRDVLRVLAGDQVAGHVAARAGLLALGVGARRRS